MVEHNRSGNILKVVTLGLENRVYEEMKKSRFSVEALTRQLNDENIHITSASIRKFIKKTKRAQQELIKKDLNVAAEVKELTMNYTSAIKDILKEVEEVKNTARGEKDYATYNQLIGRLMQGIELIAKLTGDLKPKTNVDINIIYNEINNEINKNVDTLRTDMFSGRIIDIEAEIIKQDEIAAKLIK